MKKLITSLFLAMMILSTLVLNADQDYDDLENEITNGFGVDVTENPVANQVVKKAKGYVSTNIFAYQYTIDGWLQHVAIYADSVICTNVEGPREGAQFIIMNTGALMDMCNFYKQDKDRITHTYTWGEVSTYKDCQEVTFN